MAWLGFGSIQCLPCLALDGFLSDPVRACRHLQHALTTTVTCVPRYMVEPRRAAAATCTSASVTLLQVHHPL